MEYGNRKLCSPSLQLLTSSILVVLAPWTLTVGCCDHQTVSDLFNGTLCTHGYLLQDAQWLDLFFKKSSKRYWKVYSISVWLCAVAPLFHYCISPWIHGFLANWSHCFKMWTVMTLSSCVQIDIALMDDAAVVNYVPSYGNQIAIFNFCKSNHFQKGNKDFCERLTSFSKEILSILAHNQTLIL